jgi:cytochrome oxidase Cu insertion factor (SCO1/SenC/PrrC family)
MTRQMLAAAAKQALLAAFAALLVVTSLAGGSEQGRAAQTAEERAAAQAMDDLMYGRVAVGGPFTLTDQSGRRRSDSEFRGKLLLVYFGYTYCPDICPTDLQQIGLAIEHLGEDGSAVQPLFITIDPARDTPDVLAQYVPSFYPRLIGLTGTADEIAAVAHEYKVIYRKYQPTDGGPYMIDHTGFTYIIDPSGKYRGVIPPGTPEDRMQETIRTILEQP